MAPLRFSVIVPTHRRPDSLVECVSSLEALEAPPGGFEVIVVDDGGSLPDLPAWVQTAVPDQPGPSGARNAGAALARGEILAFTDDDCTVEPGWLVELDRVASAHPGHAIGGASVNGFPDSLLSVAGQLVLDAVHSHYSADGTPAFAASLNLAVPAERFRELGGFDESFRHAEDRELCFRWLEAGNGLASAPTARVVHRRPTSLGSFLRQHAGYGRGAYAVHLRHDDGAFPEPEPKLYAELARRVRASGGSSLLLGLLVVLTQVAGVAGYALERLAHRRGIGRRTFVPVPIAEPASPSTELAGL